ncbi:MBOAT family O-acyltransferase [Anaerovibrio lipolyticus]|uniref:MBOAT family O-acyltransferase n=1 Tax=Anaerovibrio lipolyticus TaxID=82374 RepID=UPI00048102BF|nr:MBOAT family O-acyltransferase [Anaerovibrio lipolyticus]
MLFNTYEFIIVFLPIVFAGYYLIGRKSWQWGMYWIVVASLAFYGYWDIRYVPLLMASILFNYFMGRKIEAGFNRKKWIVAGICGDVALLGYFKYTAFFLTTINDVLGTEYFWVPEIILPLGISFFTFTQIAYLVDVYRDDVHSANFASYCEFVTIFPHLIAGPIINNREMIPQFISEETYKINYDNVAKGMTLFFLGLFKKVAIADSIAPWVNEYFSRPDSLLPLEAWFAAIGYTFQLYFDFSAYSEMAIGLGLMFNLRLPRNFDSPYQATSIIDFWRRWHMTLGLWVKNYLYIPMGGNRHGFISKMRNLILSMLIIGLWHGAGWTYILWGGIHGVYLAVNHSWRTLNFSLPRIIAWPITFIAVVMAWVFFRADSVGSALEIISSMVGIFDGSVVGLVFHGPTGVRVRMLVAFAVLLLFCPSAQRLVEKYYSPNKVWLAVTLLAGFVSFYFFSHISDFLYFQF